MYYNIDYQISGLILLGIVMVTYLSKKRFPSVSNRLFVIYLFTALLDIILDIITAYIPSDFLSERCIVSYSLNILLFGCHLILPVLALFYILYTFNLIPKAKDRLVLLTTIPAVISFILLISSPVTHFIFYYDYALRYVRGPLYMLLYLNSLLYYLTCFVLLIIFRKKSPFTHTLTTTLFLIPILVCGIVQFQHPFFLMNGLAFSIASLVLYLTVQDPSIYLDSLTKLFDRKAFTRYISSRFSRIEHYQLIVIALEDFRSINTTYGLRIGDLLLVNFTNYLENDLKLRHVFRISGNRFAILTDHPDFCAKTLNQLQLRLELPWDVRKNQITLSACFCYMYDLTVADSARDLISVIESSIHVAQRKGSGTVLNVNDIAKKLQRQTAIADAVKAAIEDKSFDVYYQPIYGLFENEFIYAEALIRLRTEQLGWISPAEFIPIAEETHTIIPVDRIVLDKVCSFMQNHDISNSSIRSIDVNLSNAEFEQDTIMEDMLSIIHRYDISHSQLSFEITETSATSSQDTVKQFMNAMSQKEFHFSLDDFGNGYSNLSQVMSLPFNMIKIDKSMLDSISHNVKNYVLFQSLVLIFQKMNLSVIVEGAETKEQVDMLRELGVDYVQGFYYSKPLPEKEFAEFLKKHPRFI